MFRPPLRWKVEGEKVIGWSGKRAKRRNQKEKKRLFQWGSWVRLGVWESGSRSPPHAGDTFLVSPLLMPASDSGWPPLAGREKDQRAWQPRARWPKRENGQSR